MKKFLMIHDISQKELDGNDTNLINNFTNWVRCFTDWRNTTEVGRWVDMTPQKCQDFEYVMLLLMTDQRDEKLNKFLEIVTYSQRTYKTIIYVDGVVGWQMNPFSIQNKKKYMDMVSASDYIFHYGLPESEGYWKVITRGRESHNIDRPHPVDFAKKSFDIEHPVAIEYIKQFALKDRKEIIAVGKSLKNINEERNAISSLYVAGQLQKKTGWPIITFANNPLPDNEKKAYYKDLCDIDEIIEIPVMRWNDYIKILALCRIGIHLDCLETRGQVPLDHACLRVPMVCAGSVAGQKLFPYTWLNHCRDIDKALKMAFKLVDDNKFRDKVVDYAYDKAEEYSFDNTRAKLEKILGVKI